MSTTIAVIGLGGMGRALAERLAARGFTLRVWNRTRARAEGLNATVCDSPAAAARNAALVLTSLAADDAVRDVLFGGGLLDALAGDAVHVGASTISHQLGRELGQAHAARGKSYVAAPVIGRPDAAAQGKLFVLAGGDDGVRTRCEPLFAAIGQGRFDFPTPEQANLAKILANLVLAGTIELLGEAFALGEKGGLAPARALEVLVGTLFGCPAIAGYGPRIAERRFEPAGFRMALGLKDVELALAAGHDLRAPLPTANVVRDNLLSALAQGLERLDWSGVTDVVRASAGLR
jgi:3-hydroxyisobutyrate dehydrogenase-like beta-hydroxyacid dehydrogenase